MNELTFKKIAVVGRRDTPSLTPQIDELAEFLQELGCDVYVDSTVCDTYKFNTYKCGLIEDWLDEIDLTIVLGGDGTLLSVGRLIASHDIPVVGVNKGNLGFMTDVAFSDMKNVLQDILIHGKYEEEHRSLILAQLYRRGKLLVESYALNDVVISRGAVGNMIEFELAIDDEFVHSQKSDGVIFSTPTGSTAYSLAAGGPILHPKAKVFSIVPICPQSLSNRPLVVSDDVEMEFHLVKDTPTQIHFDGQEYFDLNLRDSVMLKKADLPLRLLHPKTYNYYNTLRTKLHWSKRVS